jgi:hypothetical protein
LPVFTLLGVIISRAADGMSDNREDEEEKEREREGMLIDLRASPPFRTGSGTSGSC